MTNTSDAAPALSPRQPRKRKLRRFLIAGALGLVLLVILLPTLLSFGPARWLATALLNRNVHGRVELGSVSCGWFSGLRIGGLTIADSAGNPVVRGGRIEVRRGLAGLILDQHRLGTIALHDLDLEVITDPDGTTNLSRLLSVPEVRAHEQVQDERADQPWHPKPAQKRNPLADLVLCVTVDGLNVHYSDRRNANELTLRDGSGELQAGAGAGAITYSAKGRVLGAGTPGSIDLQGQLDRDLSKPSGTAQLHAEALPLRFASKLLDALGANVPLGFDGTVTTNTRIELAGLDSWSASGEMSFDRLQGWGAILGSDRPRLERVAVPFDIQGTGEAVLVRRFDLISAVASLSARGQIHLASSPPTAERVAVEGSVDLARLSRLIPATLHLQKDVEIQAGVAALSLHGSSTADKLLAKAELSVRDLAALRQGQRLSLEEPILARVGAHSEGKTVQVDEAEVQSSFLQLSGSGNLADAELNANADLARLRAELAKFIDLGPLELAGKSTIRLKSNTQPDGGMAMQVGASLTGLHLGGVATPLDEPSARISGQFQGQRKAGGSRLGIVLTSARLNLSATTANLRAELDGPANRPDVRFAVEGDADLAKLVGQWGKLLGLAPTLQVTGMAGVKLAGNYQEGAVRLDPSLASLAKVRIVNPKTRRGFEEEALDVTLAGQAAKADGGAALDLSNCTVKSSTFSATFQSCKLAGLGSSGPRVELSAQTAGDLEKVTALLDALSDEPAAVRRSGRWEGGVSAAASGSTIQVKLETRVKDFREVDEHGQVVFSDPTIVLTAQAGLVPAAGKLTLAEFTAQSDFLACRASGTLDDWRDAKRIDLAGKLTYDWAALSRRLPALASPELAIRGRESQPFSVRGSLKGDTSAQIARGLTAALSFGIEGAEISGISLGPARAATEIRDGRIEIAPIRTVANNGQVQLSPTIDLNPAVPVLSLPAGPVLSNVEINQKVCQGLLRYVSPVFNDVTDAEGKLSLILTRDGARVPLDRNELAAAVLDGHLTIDAVIQTEGVVKDLMAITGQSGPVRLPISQSIEIRIARGRLYEQGLTIPIRGESQAIRIAGSIGFDETLDLVASVPITPRMLGGDRQLAELLKDQQIEVPIQGTLNRPEIDHRALSSNVRRLTRKVGRQTIEKKAEEFLNGGKSDELLDRFLKKRHRPRANRSQETGGNEQ